MPRLTKRVVKEEPPPRTDANVGRELQEFYRHQNEAVADKLTVGEGVEYWDDGWRYGKVDKLPESDEARYGQVRIMHQITGTVWVDGRDIKPLKMEWGEYFKWKKGGDDPPEEKKDDE